MDTTLLRPMVAGKWRLRFTGAHNQTLPVTTRYVTFVLLRSLPHGSIVQASPTTTYLRQFFVANQYTFIFETTSVIVAFVMHHISIASLPKFAIRQYLYSEGVGNTAGTNVRRFKGRA